jgi:hypothetical protein
VKRTQLLSSGLAVRQDFSDAVRAVFFQTEYDEFFYATHGGTLFMVCFPTRLYGLTCKHVFGDFQLGKLFVTQEKHAKKGSMPAPVTCLCFPSTPSDDAAGTDVIDICAIQFAEDISPDFFKGNHYIIDKKTVGTSKVGHELHVVGVLKDKSGIIPPDITMGFCELQMHDAGPTTFDPFLRTAKAKFNRPDFTNLVGISGSPVFDHTANVLCGMVVRGGMLGDKCTVYYIDITDIIRVLESFASGATRMQYIKNIVPARQRLFPMD